uniref:Uncharacterized protein n=1 Tax=Saccharum spontaneum TaxID=62335 RepID=A0A678T564_SACSP|nr:hypothetical protein SS11P21_000011 [Saccharum spontaneum]
MTTALAVTDEVPLLIRAVGDLAAAAEVSLEEVAVITQCTALGCDSGLMEKAEGFGPEIAFWSFLVAPLSCLCSICTFLPLPPDCLGMNLMLAGWNLSGAGTWC